jgi:uncharacterized protein (TIGR02118 family)
MFKIIILSKRKAGISMQEFRDYYETRHAVLAPSLTPLVRGYVRHYLIPLESPLHPNAAEPSVDCVTEVWWDNERDFREAMKVIADPSLAATISEDEEQFADRSSIRWFRAADAESALNQRTTEAR